MGVLDIDSTDTCSALLGGDMRLEWVQLSRSWHKLIDHENQKDWWVKYRSYGKGRSKSWQMVYFDFNKNHGLLQSEVSEEQLRRNLEMEYLLMRGEA
jgi:hypothetical protein